MRFFGKARMNTTSSGPPWPIASACGRHAADGFVEDASARCEGADFGDGRSPFGRNAEVSRKTPP